jgi:hypothetical protein
MKTTYNYFRGKQPIQKSEFLANVPENWEEQVDEFGEFSWGYFKAILLD